MRVDEVLFGLGANLGSPRRQLAAAVENLRAVVEEVRVSSLYRTKPVGFEDQPDYLNVVVVGSSAGPPERLLEEAFRIERELGRVRTFPNAPRTIDIDILALGDLVVEKSGLTLPHPRMHLRPFVLIPLAEVAPEWRHPVHGLTAAEMLAGLTEQEGVERIGGLSAPA